MRLPDLWPRHLCIGSTPLASHSTMDYLQTLHFVHIGHVPSYLNNVMSTWDLVSCSRLCSVSSHCCELPQSENVVLVQLAHCPGTHCLQLFTICRFLSNVILKLCFSLVFTDISCIILSFMLNSFYPLTSAYLRVSRQTVNYERVPENQHVGDGKVSMLSRVLMMCLLLVTDVGKRLSTELSVPGSRPCRQHQWEHHTESSLGWGIRQTCFPHWSAECIW